MGSAFTTSEEKRTIGLTTASHSLVHLFENVMPPLIPLLTVYFSTDYFHLGLVVTIFSYAFGLGALPAGFFADRFGHRRFVTAYLFGAGILSAAIFFSGTLASYAVLMGLIGLFCSVYHPAANTLISHVIRAKGRAFGIHGIAGSLGVALAPVLSASIGAAAGWKAPHILLGAMGVAVGFFSLTLKTNRPEINPSPRMGVDENDAAKTPYLNFVIFFLSVTSLGLTYKGILTFLPTFMGQRVSIRLLGLDAVSIGGAVATLALLSGSLGQYLAGRLVDRYQPEKIYFFVVALGTFFVFIMAMSSDLLLVLASILYAFLYFATQPTQNYILSKYTPLRRQGLLFGLHFFLLFGVGSTAAALSGYLADRFGLASVFYAMGGCFAASALLLLVLVFRSGKAYSPALR